MVEPVDVSAYQAALDQLRTGEEPRVKPGLFVPATVSLILPT